MVLEVSDPAAEFLEEDFDPTAEEELADSDHEISLEEIERLKAERHINLAPKTRR